MAFTEMAFTPATGLKDTTVFVQQPASEAAARAQIQTPLDQLRDFINNTFIPEIQSVEADVSGASKIGSETIGGVTGTSVRAQIADLKAQIDVLSLSASGLADGVVVTAYLANLAVTAAKLATDAVETLKIKDLAVTTDKIADDAITQPKIAAGAVGATELSDGSVSVNKIAAGAVTPAKLSEAYMSAAGGTFTNDLGILKAAATANFNIGANAGYQKFINLNTNVAGTAKTRWSLRSNNTAEGGANAGSDFFIAAYNDDGTWRSDIFKIDRATGLVTINSGLADASLTASKAMVTDANKRHVSSAATAAELGYLSGVTSAIQTQLNAKAAASLISNKITVSASAPSDPTENDIWIDIS